MPRKKGTKLNFKGWLKAGGAIFLVVLVLLVIVPQLLRATWLGKVYPNVTVGSINLGGMAYEEAQHALQEQWNTMARVGIPLEFEGKELVVYPTVTAPGDPDLSYEVVQLNYTDTVDEVFAVGREQSFYAWVLAPYVSLVRTHDVPALVTVVPAALQQMMHENFGEYFTEVRNAQFEISGDEISLIAEQSGTSIDTLEAVRQLEVQFAIFDTTPIPLTLVSIEPEVHIQDIRPLIVDAREILARAPFTLEVDIIDSANRRFYWSDTVTAHEMQSWLGAAKGEEGAYISFTSSLDDYLERSSGRINREPRDAKFDIAESGRLSQFQTSRDGRALNISETHIKLERDLVENKQRKSELVVDIVEPAVSTEAANNLGIKEVLGTGTSDFSGSPRNRRINIRVASDKLNGLLLAPGEEFSLVETLKPFTEEAGYVPELVIKGKKLIPEIGGGACQIGTTTFRAALNAGLDITARRNHSFAVAYYNDENGLPGTDATIYDPAPDFRFKNDTEHHVLIQTHVGDDDILTYTFWGTSDGREASVTTPEILAKFAAPETKYVETEELEPGETECSGGNVPGYNTTFKYTVSRPDGSLHEENFDSHYRPFQRVCLVGVEKIEDKEDPSASSGQESE